MIYPDTLTVYTRPLAADSAGGESPGSPVEVYAALQARVSVLGAQDELREFGTASGRYWRVITPPALLVDYPADQYFVQVLAQSTSLLQLGKEYQVVKARHQRRGGGAAHHTSLIIQEAGDG